MQCSSTQQCSGRGARRPCRDTSSAGSDTLGNPNTTGRDSRSRRALTYPGHATRGTHSHPGYAG